MDRDSQQPESSHLFHLRSTNSHCTQYSCNKNSINITSNYGWKAAKSQTQGHSRQSLKATHFAASFDAMLDFGQQFEKQAQKLSPSLRRPALGVSLPVLSLQV